MANYLSSPSNPASSLQPPDGDRAKAEELPKLESDVDLAKRFYELQALNDRVTEENQRLAARNLVLEEMCREHRRLLEDRDEQIIRLKEEAMSMSGTEGRLKEKYERLYKKYRTVREGFEAEERKWKEEAKKSEEKSWRMQVEKRKMEIELVAARRGGDGGGDLVEKMLKQKEAMISDLESKIEVLEKEKVKLEKELGDRLVNLEDAVGKWMVGKAEKSFRMSPDAGIVCNVHSKGNDDLQKSASKYVGISLIQPKKETIEDDVQVKGHDSKASIGSMVPDVEKEVPYAPKSTASPIVEISDDEDEDEHGEQEQEKVQEEVKRSSSVAFPSTTKRPGNFAFPKRKIEAVSCPVVELAETKRCKQDGLEDGKLWESASKELAETKRCKRDGLEDGKLWASASKELAETKRCKHDGLEDGKLWESASKMFNAFTTNGELCMKSVCALYRKQEALGVWKNSSVENNTFRPDAWDIAALGKCLTDGDPEGKMKKSLAQFEREYPVGIEKCRDIARRHHKKLFEIYSNNQDPLFLP